MRTTIWCAAVLGVAIFGGWWAARAAATGAEPRTQAPANVAATMNPDDTGFRKLLDEVRRRSAELDQREREVMERAAALESLEEAVAESLSGSPARASVEDVGGCRLHGGVTRIYENMRPEEAAQ